MIDANFKKTPIQTLNHMLFIEEHVPLYDQSGTIVTPEGAKAEVRAQMVRECIYALQEIENES